ncbi:MAG TPA: FHA domain-containing protein [Kofleriaceae bacterium]
MRARWLIALIATGLLVSTRAHADDEPVDVSTSRVVVDRVDLEPSVLGGTRLRVFVSAVTQQGKVVDLTEPKSLKINAGNTNLNLPYALGRFGASKSELALVILLQTTIDFAEVTPAILETLDSQLLAGLGEKTTQVALVTYGDSIGAGKLTSLKSARGNISSLANQSNVSDPVLLDTLERALALLKKVKTTPPGRPMRKIIVVIGDGRDASFDRDRVTRIGQRADKEGVRIHSFAFAPTNKRKPLLVLGELSKQSLGTFRWLERPGAESWGPRFAQLRDEITEQYVIALFPDAEQELPNKKISVASAGRLTLSSLNAVKVPPSTCNGVVCGSGQHCLADRCHAPGQGTSRGVLGWILLVGGILLGIVVVLGLIGFVITKRQEAQSEVPVVPGVPGSVPPPSKPPKSKPPKSKPPASQPPPEIAKPVAAPIGPGPKLYIMSGPRTGEQLMLKHGFTIGKAGYSDLLIDDGFTSTNHAQIGMDHFGNCRLYDMNSTNGTFVNGVRVTGEHILEHGNTVKIGSTELRFLAQ